MKVTSTNKLEFVDTDKLINNISCLLSELITENSNIQRENYEAMNDSLNIFSSRKIPSISIKSFFERIVKYSQIENNTLIIALIYIDRICDRKNLKITYINVHR